MYTPFCMETPAHITSNHLPSPFLQDPLPPTGLHIMGPPPLHVDITICDTQVRSLLDTMAAYYYYCPALSIN